MILSIEGGKSFCFHLPALMFNGLPIDEGPGGPKSEEEMKIFLYPPQKKIN